MKKLFLFLMLSTFLLISNSCKTLSEEEHWIEGDVVCKTYTPGAIERGNDPWGGDAVKIGEPKLVVTVKTNEGTYTLHVVSGYSWKNSNSPESINGRIDYHSSIGKKAKVKFLKYTLRSELCGSWEDESTVERYGKSLEDFFINTRTAEIPASYVYVK